ncbi:hypothetical protein R4Z09_22510 [Niallia oryzisoli]|uniref:L-lactate dehydrogenase n=1 Tax=Niallia oryzisoli TaxID=1737571 RepID=A0ABZ2CFW4_9BACI
MGKISIIGAAGTLGATCAMCISLKDFVDELCLIDVNETLLDNHVMDFENAFPSKTIYRGSYKDLEHSDIIIITAGVPNRNEVTSRTAYLADNIRIFNKIGEQITKYAPKAIIVTASNPVDILNYYLFENFGFNRSQLIGYTLNDSLRFEWSIRKILNINHKNVIKSPVLGEHGNSQVPLFSHVLQNNSKLVFTSEQKARIQEELQNWFVRFNSLNIKRTTGWTTGVGISQIVHHLLHDNLVSTIGSTILRGEYGFSDVSIGVPIIVNKKGVQTVLEWDLEPSERKAFNESVQKIKTLIEENKTLFVN